jgi:glycosyltransferase involved in cell wall biosynthesis
MLTGQRIAIVHQSLEIGGAELQSLHIAAFLKATGNAVEIIGFSSPGALTPRCDALGLPWSIVPIDIRHGRTRRFIDFARLALALRRRRLNILLPFCDYPNVYCGAVWRYSGARQCVWNQRGLDYLCQRSRLAQTVLRRSPCVISNSQHQLDLLIRNYGLAPANTHVIHNGVQLLPPKVGRAGWRERLNIPRDAFVACMLANHAWYKDHDTLLRAWREVTASVPEAHPVLVLPGRTAERGDELKRLSAELGLDGAVRFPGFIDDVSGLFEAADLSVFSSSNEGVPNGVLESMASGLPVVASDDPSIRQAIGPTGLELLAPPRDPGALAEKIKWAIHHPDERQRLGAANRERAATVFSVRRMCEEYAALLEDHRS